MLACSNSRSVLWAQLPALDYASLAAASFMPQTPLGPQLRFLPPSPSHSGNTFAPSSLDSRTASGTLGNGSSLTAGGLTPPPAAGTPSSHHNPGVHSGSGSTIGGGMGGLGYLGQPGSSLHARLSSAAAGGGGSVGLGGLSGMGINNGYLFDRWVPFSRSALHEWSECLPCSAGTVEVAEDCSLRGDFEL